VAVREIAPIHEAQVISYMKLMDIPLGLLMNFNEVRLVRSLLLRWCQSSPLLAGWSPPLV
jgi:GxxExxY protein